MPQFLYFTKVAMCLTPGEFGLRSSLLLGSPRSELFVPRHLGTPPARDLAPGGPDLEQGLRLFHLFLHFPLHGPQLLSLPRKHAVGFVRNLETGERAARGEKRASRGHKLRTWRAKLGGIFYLGVSVLDETWDF